MLLVHEIQALETLLNFDDFDQNSRLYYLIKLQAVKVREHLCISTFEVQS